MGFLLPNSKGLILELLLNHWSQKYQLKYNAIPSELSLQAKTLLQKLIKKYGEYHIYNCINYYFRNSDYQLTLSELLHRKELFEIDFLDQKIAKPLWLMDKGQLLEMCQMVDLYFNIRLSEPEFAEEIAELLNHAATRI